MPSWNTLKAGWCVLALTGCADLAYYGQAIQGHLHIQHATRPISEVLADPRTPADTQERLRQVQHLRNFASDVLQLPRNASYTRYAQLQRPYVVWAVFAAPADRLELKQWCFPVAGCVPYRGYFSQADAQTFAAELRADGWDVHIAGVPAYSTLGWFDDPVLDTWLYVPLTEVARILFHELAHQTAYAPGDGAFNEAFATALERLAVAHWLQQHGTPNQKSAWHLAQQRQQAWLQLLTRYRERLHAWYTHTPDPAQRLAGKAEILAALHTDYRRLQHDSWQGFSGYDRWFAAGVNNAALAAVATYHAEVSAFEQLFELCGSDFSRFYAQVKILAAQPRAVRQIIGPC